jgi:hemolysin activation/secretion protein
LGQGKTIDDVETTRARLEQVYRDAGYGTVLVDIPEQDVEEGVVRLRVTEGRVGRLRVSGSRYFSLGKIREGVPSLAAGAVPHLPKVQEDLNALNRASSDRQVSPVLRPGKTPGTFDVDLKVADEFPLHGEVSLDDRFTPDTSRLRLGALLRYDNLWQRQHSISLNYLVSPENADEVEVFSGTYLARFASTDKMLALYGVSSSSNVATVGSLAVVGNGAIVGLRGIAPMPALEHYFHTVTLGADYKDFAESIVLQGADTLNTPIDYMSFLVSYNGTLQEGASTTKFDLGVTFGIRGLVNTEDEFGGRDTGEVDDEGRRIIEGGKRFGSKPNFIYLRAMVEHLHKLPGDFGLLGRMNAQVSDSPLISNEQFALGGFESVRGYLDVQQLADHGLTGTVELRTPQLAKRLGDPLDELEFAAFVDGGIGGLEDALPDQQANFSLLSAGLGMRLAAWKHLNAMLFWAWPFLDAGSTAAGDPRFHFKIGYEF